MDYDYHSFSQLRLATPLERALRRLKYLAPSPIQRLAIPPQLAGRDLLGVAATGSGKTVAFGLPLLHTLLTQPRTMPPRGCRALVLVPTRELARQTVVVLRSLSGRRHLCICPVFGGVPRQRQIDALALGADVVVATPGRLIDLMQVRALGLGQTEHLVIDEADRLLGLGFLEPVRRIVAHLPPDRQTVMFSATMPAPVAALAAQLLRAPVRAEAAAAPDEQLRIATRAELVAADDKRRRLIEIVEEPAVTRAIVFCRTRRGADIVARALARAGVAAGVVHGEHSQEERFRTLKAFRHGGLAVLVATDLAARGIDVQGVSHVVNYDLPDDAVSYIHRIGRTGRAGASGEAVTLCVPADLGRLRRIERATRKPLLPPAR